jgi:hypothetical protein
MRVVRVGIVGLVMELWKVCCDRWVLFIWRRSHIFVWNCSRLVVLRTQQFVGEVKRHAGKLVTQH